MKALLIIATLALSSTFAIAAPLCGNEQVGVETIIRQVLNKKLLKGQHVGNQNHMLKALLEGAAGTHYTSIRITRFQCDGALGFVSCNIHILDATNDGTESLSDLQVKIRQGEVRSAFMTVIAG